MELLDDGVNITNELHNYTVRAITALSRDNCDELFKLMKYSSDYYYRYTDLLNSRISALNAMRLGIDVSVDQLNPGELKSLFEDEIVTAEEKRIPWVPRESLLRLEEEYKKHEVDKSIKESTKDLIFLFMCIEEQVKYLEKQGRKYERKSERWDKFSSILDSDIFAKRSKVLEEMQKLTEEIACLLIMIKTFSSKENIDESRKLADFAMSYYAAGINMLGRELNDTSESNFIKENEDRIALIKRFITDKLKEIKPKNRELIKN